MRCDESEIRCEYILTTQKFSDCGNGYDIASVTEFPPGKTEPIRTCLVHREGRTGKVVCSSCADDFVGRFDESKCEHEAVYRTFNRQKQPLGRIYFVTWDGTVGYWKRGGMVLLSTVRQVVGKG